jgi:hypothetical protein
VREEDEDEEDGRSEESGCSRAVSAEAEDKGGGWEWSAMEKEIMGDQCGNPDRCQIHESQR